MTGNTSNAHIPRITIVVDNDADQGLFCEHGFSAWIENAGRRVLFDTGQGPAFAGNIEKLGVDLRTADAVVLSHGHYDHTGNLPPALAHAPAAKVYAHPAATGPRYAIRDGVAKAIAMPAPARAALAAHRGDVCWATQAMGVAEGVGITGPIPRRTDYEDTGGPFFVDSDGAQPDPIEDDLALWMPTRLGLVVVVGCSHAGLMNTLQYALELSGESRLHAVLGGFHLAEAGDARLTRTMAALQELGPDVIIPCHCTGEAAVERLRQAFGARVAPGRAGAVYRFGAGA